MLPPHPAHLALRFVGSVFGDYALHGCAVTTTLALPADGYHPPAPLLPS